MTSETESSASVLSATNRAQVTSANSIRETLRANGSKGCKGCLTRSEYRVLTYSRVPDAPLSEVFPPVMNRDADFEFARHHTTPTWQKMWWRMSGGLDGLFLRALCEAWSCTPESVLAPVEQRRWSDIRHLDDENLGTVPGYLLHRPAALPSP